MKYLVQNTGPNRSERNAALFGDKTSGHGGSKGGQKMRDNAVNRLGQIMKGRQLYTALFLRAGIILYI